VTSVDFSHAGVEKTDRLATSCGVAVDTKITDLTDYDLGVNKWDAVVSIFAHMASKIRSKVHHHVPVALRSGGVFLLEAYTPNQIGRGTGGRSLVEMMMTLGELWRDLDGLELLCTREFERDISEGTGHTGLSRKTEEPQM
jgi:hypothetical protein